MSDSTPIPAYTVHYGISVRMLGPNGGGHGAKRGHVMHAVAMEDVGHGYVEGRALCRYRPSYDWSSAYAEPVTCPKCLRKIQKMEQKP